MKEGVFMTKCTVFPVIDLTETGRQIEVCVIRRFFVYNTVTALLWKLCDTYYRKIRD